MTEPLDQLVVALRPETHIRMRSGKVDVFVLQLGQEGKTTELPTDYVATLWTPATSMGEPYRWSHTILEEDQVQLPSVDLPAPAPIMQMMPGVTYKPSEHGIVLQAQQHGMVSLPRTFYTGLYDNQGNPRQ